MASYYSLISRVYDRLYDITGQVYVDLCYCIFILVSKIKEVSFEGNLLEMQSHPSAIGETDAL